MRTTFNETPRPARAGNTKGTVGEDRAHHESDEEGVQHGIVPPAEQPLEDEYGAGCQQPRISGK